MDAKYVLTLLHRQQETGMQLSVILVGGDRRVKQDLDYESASQLLLVFANAKRVEILSILVTREICVSELAGLTEMSQSALSQHLALLRKCKLVSTRREFQKIFYHSKSREVHKILSVLADISMASSSDRVPEISNRLDDSAV